MRVTLREAALLALPALSNAVSLSDMTPRANNLPSACEAVYTSQIYGCTPQDFQALTCSQDCINGLYGLAQAISHTCAGQGVTGQNLVVAFLAGVGPQQLCHNAAGSSPEPGPPTSLPSPTQTHWTPSIGSSTTTAPKETGTGSLLIDTSSTQTATIITPHKTQTTTTTSSSQPAQTTTTKTAAVVPLVPHTTTTHSTTAGTTTSAAGSSQTNLNDHSGGGSPFDTSGNMNAAPGVSLSLGSTILSAVAAILLAIR